MTQLSTLDLLLTDPRVSRSKQSKLGYAAGLVHSAGRKERMEQMRPQLHELLLKRYTFADMARTIGTTEMTIGRYVKADSELSKLATYIKPGSYDRNKAKRSA